MANILLSDIVTRVQNLLGTDAQLSDAEIRSMAISRYEILHDAHPWSKRRKEFVINTVGQITSNSGVLVTATDGSATVSSAGSPFGSTYNDMQIQIGSQRQYYFVSYNAATNISLEDGNGNAATWPAATVGANTWRLFQTRYNLPTDSDILISLGYDYPIPEFDGGRPALDNADPHRESVGADIRRWVYAGVSGTTRQIEVWPVPTAARTLRGQYLTEAAQITATYTISNVHPAVLTYAIAADCYNMLWSKQGDPFLKELALFYEKKATEALNDILPHEVSRNNPPTSIYRQRRRFGKGTDWEVDHDLDNLDI